MTYQSLHDALCADGDDACGGPFEHQRCIDELVQVAIGAINANSTTTAVTDVADTAISNANTANVVATAVAEPDVTDDGVDETVEGCVIPRPQNIDTPTHPGMAHALTDSMH